MTKLEVIEKQIASLDPQDIKKLAEWFEEYKAERWDQRIEADIEIGVFDDLAAQVLADHKAGKTQPL
jgi:hypothetical protein